MTERGSAKRRKKTDKAAARRERAGSWVVDRNHPRSERRFVSATTIGVWITVIALSVAGLLAGAGATGQWLLGDQPHRYAPYLLVGGVVITIGVALMGRWSSPPVRVGDAGIAVERQPTELDRIGWNEVTEVILSGDVLTFQAHGRIISIPASSNGQAFARAVAELKRRRPDKAGALDGDVAGPKLDDAAGEVLPLEPPQVAGKRCRASDRLVAFERDGRLCERCGEVYHKDGVPRACVVCGAGG